jgi:uncharacterized protein
VTGADFPAEIGDQPANTVSSLPTSEHDLAAGEFSSWVVGMQAAIRGERGSDVPCGGCTACCTSSQFVHIAPDETDTLAHIPGELLFPAPRLPRGHVVLGYDQRGHCPMLVDGRCSIYEHRPRACRTYDCRVFPAAGVEPEDSHGLIPRQARRWRFSHATEESRARYDAVRAAAASLACANPTERAVRAIEIHDAFLSREP